MVGTMHPVPFMKTKSRHSHVKPKVFLPLSFCCCCFQKLLTPHWAALEAVLGVKVTEEKVTAAVS